MAFAVIIAAFIKDKPLRDGKSETPGEARA